MRRWNFFMSLVLKNECAFLLLVLLTLSKSVGSIYVCASSPVDYTWLYQFTEEMCLASQFPRGQSMVGWAYGSEPVVRHHGDCVMGQNHSPHDWEAKKKKRERTRGPAIPSGGTAWWSKTSATPKPLNPLPAPNGTILGCTPWEGVLSRAKP